MLVVAALSPMLRFRRWMGCPGDTALAAVEANTRNKRILRFSGQYVNGGTGHGRPWFGRAGVAVGKLLITVWRLFFALRYPSAPDVLCSGQIGGPRCQERGADRLTRRHACANTSRVPASASL
jgi:hypothetical protein